MKNIILKTTLLFVSFLTFAQNNESNCNYNDSIFKLLPSEMTFNIEKYKVELQKGTEKKIIINNENYEKYFRGDTTSIHYVQLNKILKINKTITYYPNGKIESFDIFHNPEEGLVTGLNKRMYFNVDGTIEEEKDIDKGYKICYDEAINIVKKIVGEKKIKRYELKFSVGRVDLNKFTESNAEWYVGVKGNDEFYNRNKKSHLITYVIDGITGKFISKRINRIVP
ncbi:hypothetical protein [Flavobacterium sp.]|uniref:hypothetical protein n=1 Tax=Flavobacterium sp. TaxID=239 RepID=UPI00286CA5FA|nr:hypothetical protein [Flavobacterium sp.]